MKKLPLIICTFTFMLLLIVKPAYFLQSATNGLTIFSTALLPSLFPFFFCSLLLTKCGGVDAISKLFGKPISKLYKCQPLSSFAMFISLISGYPSGASTCQNLYQDGYANKDDIVSMLAFTSSSGPLFIMGTVGVAIYHNSIYGIIILLSHYLATILNGFVWRFKNKQPNNQQLTFIPIDNAFGEAIYSSTLSMLSVGGYIVIFNMVIDAIMLLPFELNEKFSAIMYGLIEMTRGIIFASKIKNSMLSIAISTALITFGGFSVTMQSTHFLTKCGVSFGQYFSRKITQTIFSIIFSIIFSTFLA